MSGSSDTRVAEVLVRLLEAAGVDTVFGIPGVHTVALYRALAASGIRHVTPRHEQGAAFMADGYARASGRFGVCFTITGPGLVNALTAMAQARGDGVPMFVVSAVNARATLGRGLGELHELPDQRVLAGTVALASRTLLDPVALDATFAELLATMREGRPGPVHLEIPTDLLDANVPADASAPSRLRREPAPRPPAPEALAEAATLAAAAHRPLLVAGGGAACHGALLRRLARRLDAPLVSTASARGVAAGEPLEVPASPSLDAVRALVDDADLVLAVGTEIGATDYDMHDTGRPFAPRRLLRVDIDPRQLARGPAATLGVVADAGAFLEALLAALDRTASASGAPGGTTDAASTAATGGAATATGGGAGSASTAATDDGATVASTGAARAAAARRAALEEIGPRYRAQLDLFAAIWRALPDALVVGDSTEPVYAANLYLEAPTAGRWFNSATGFGTLGYAAPAAIGAALARTRDATAPAAADAIAPGTAPVDVPVAGRGPVVCLIGDGGLQFSLAELGSAADARADVVFVVWNDRGYGEIARAMRAAGVLPPLGTDPTPPDFVAVAGAWGLPARRVADAAGLGQALGALARPCLVEIDANEG